VVTVAAWASVVAFVAAGLGSALLGRSVFLATDLMQRWAPWRSLALGDGSATNIWLGDTLDSAVPQSVLVKQSVLDGHLDVWNPYLAGGVPLGSLPDTGLFSPVSWIWFLVPDSYAPGAAKLVETAVVLLGFVLLGRRLRLSPAAQAIAGLVFVSSGFMVAWTNWPQTRVAALVPLLFWACDRAIVLRRLRDAVPVALVLGSMLLGGFPAIIGYAVYGVLAYAVVRLAVERAPWRDWVRAVGVGALGALLGAAVAAWQLVPFALNTSSTIDLAGRAQTSSMHLGLDSLATALVPDILGNADDPTWVGTGNPIERFSFLGVGALVLVAVAVVVRRRGVASSATLYALGGAAVCLVLLYVGGPFLGLAQELPIFADNLVTRLRVMLGFFVALGAALGYDALTRTTDEEAPVRRRRATWVVAVLVAALGAAGAVLIVRRALYLVPAERIDQVRSGTIVIGAVALACLLLALLARTRGRAWRTAAGVVFPVVLAGQAAVVVDGWWPQSDPATFYPTTAMHEFLDENLGDERFISVGQTALPGTSSLYRLRAANGHAFHTAGWRALLEEADPGAMLSPTYSVTSMDGLTSPALDRLAVRYAVADPGSPLTGDVEELGASVRSQSLEPDGTAISVPFAGPARGVLVELPDGVSGDRSAGVRIALVDANGDERTATDQVTGAVPAGTSIWVALAGEDVGPDEQLRATVTPLGDSAAGVATTADGEWAVGVVRPPDDGLTVVHTGDATVYERATALDRFRWASQVRVEPDEDRRVALLGSRSLPATAVVLDAPGQPADAGATADVEVVEDAAQRVELAVSSTGAGYLVVADSLNGGGWSATVDGADAELVPADEAGAAVRLTAGESRVVLTYEPPGWRAGWTLTWAGWLVVVAIVVPLVVARVRRRRVPDRTAGAEQNGEVTRAPEN
jgi:hypothetical protein